MIILLLIIGPHNNIYQGNLNIFEIIVVVIIYLTALMTVISGAEYMIKNKSVLKEGE